MSLTPPMPTTPLAYLPPMPPPLTVILIIFVHSNLPECEYLIYKMQTFNDLLPLIYIKKPSICLSVNFLSPSSENHNICALQPCHFSWWPVERSVGCWGGVLGLARTGGMWLLEVCLDDCLVWFFPDACLSICFMSETQKVCSNKRKCNSNLSRLLKFYNWSNASKIR